MEQRSQTQAPDFEKKPFFENSEPIEVSRTFQAPVESVFLAWSNPELLKQWWGPEDYSCPEAQMDFRVGGKYRIAMQGPDKKVIWGTGTYLEIIPEEKLAFTDQFADATGNVVSASYYDMTGDWPETMYVTVEFEPNGDNGTKMSLVHEGIPKDMHDDCVKGWDSSFNKLQKLVERS